MKTLINKPYLPALAVSLFLLITLASCQKENTSPNTVDTTPPPLVSASSKAVLITISDKENSPEVLCYNADLTVRWQKKYWANPGVAPLVRYYKGRVYSWIVTADSPGGQIYTSMVASDIQTGQPVWQKKLPVSLYTMIVRNDTIIGSAGVHSGNYVICYNANTGDSLYTINSGSFAFPVLKFALHNNFLFMEAASDIFSTTDYCFNLSTRAMQWTMPLGRLRSYELNHPLFNFIDNRLYISNLQGGVSVLNIQDGKTIADRNDITFGFPVMYDKRLYAPSGNQGEPHLVVAVNALDGSLQWKDTVVAGRLTSSNVTLVSAASNHVYVYEFDQAFNPVYPSTFLASLNATTGKPEWKVPLPISTSQLIATGDRVYIMNAGYKPTLMMAYNAGTGTLEATITVPDHEALGSYIVATTDDEGLPDF